MDRNNKDYRIRISTVAKMDVQKQSDEQLLTGKFVKMAKGYAVKYEEESENGLIQTMIKVAFGQDGGVTVSRKGCINARMSFVEGECNPFHYDTPVGRLHFCNETKEIVITEDEERFTLEISYALYDGHKADPEAKVSDNRFMICIFL